MQDEATPPTKGPVGRHRRLVVFADGTGNAFSQQESNIWRLYQALEKADNRQVARYIPGVGTSSIGILRYLDAATGLGVPANVRKLYRFLCWNWQSGNEQRIADEIYMFGFSRGAFTIRTLAALVRTQGLMPRRIGDRDVTTLEMHRNAMTAWRAYRKQTAPFRKDGKPMMNPLIALVRELRDGIVVAKRALFRQTQHKEVVAAQKAQGKIGPEQVDIRFLGLFDTVEAYGVPLEDLRGLINWWVWPISFRNNFCAAVVRNVKHALSIDEERLTFKPLRFDQGDRTDGKIGPRIEEVWFAGVHSDVGGGYADDEASFEPLLWIADEASRQELEFVPDILDRYRERVHKHATLHDSRAGFAATYRYCPRTIESGKASGGTPIVHQSALQKMLSATGGYAPLTLPDDFRFLQALPDRSPAILPKPSTLRRDPVATERLEATILWRRITNLSFVGTLVLFGIFPWVATYLDNRSGLDQSKWMILGRMPEAVAGLIPGFLSPWVNAVWSFPFFGVPLIAIAVFLYFANTKLRDQIRDQALMSWTGTHAPKDTPPPPAFLTSSGTWLRTSGVFGGLYTLGAKRLTPLLVFAAALLALAYAVHVVTLRVATATSRFCPESTMEGVETTDLLPGQTLARDNRLFKPKNPCWFSGVNAVKGRTYWVRLDAVKPFRDFTVATPLAGFASCSAFFDIAAPFRRADARWFQPVAQIGRSGTSITPLEQFGGPPAPQKTEDADGKHLPRVCPTAQADNEPFIAKFTAPADGPLFLFVNDAMPFGSGRLYGNNKGKAIVTIGAESPGL